MTRADGETRECGLCHRVGLIAFIPWGPEAWACKNDRACARRMRRRARRERRNR